MMVQLVFDGLDFFFFFEINCILNIIYLSWIHFIIHYYS